MKQQPQDAQPLPVATPRQKLALRIATKPAYIKTEVTATNLCPKQVLSVMCEHLSLIAEQHNATPGSVHVDLPQHFSGTARARMTSSSHALILIPDTDAIRLYVLPIKLAHGSYRGSAFEPDCILAMTEHEGTVHWQTRAGAPLTMAVMNATCHSLFRSLITQSTPVSG